jgi:hypothetical protein
MRAAKFADDNEVELGEIRRAICEAGRRVNWASKKVRDLLHLPPRDVRVHHLREAKRWTMRDGAAEVLGVGDLVAAMEQTFDRLSVLLSEVDPSVRQAREKHRRKDPEADGGDRRPGRRLVAWKRHVIRVALDGRAKRADPKLASATDVELADCLAALAWVHRLDRANLYGRESFTDSRKRWRKLLAEEAAERDRKPAHRRTQ